MNELVPKGGWKLGRDSYSKLVVYFKDGNVRTLWSLDWRHRYSKFRDRQTGIARLQKKIKDYGAKADVAIIYDKATGNPIAKYFEGEEKRVQTNDDEYQ
jgi:hypothetical protein